MRTIIVVFAALFILILVAFAAPGGAQSAKLSGLSQRRDFVRQGCGPLAKGPKATLVKMRSAGKVCLETKKNADKTFKRAKLDACTIKRCAETVARKVASETRAQARKAYKAARRKKRRETRRIENRKDWIARRAAEVFREKATKQTNATSAFRDARVA